jgi:hypothetical protein
MYIFYCILFACLVFRAGFVFFVVEYETIHNFSKNKKSKKISIKKYNISIDRLHMQLVNKLFVFFFNKKGTYVDA